MTEQRMRQYRIGLAILFSSLALGYLVAIVIGKVDEHRRIDATSLAAVALTAIGAALLTSPGFLSRVKFLELQGFKLEMLERVKERQVQQEQQLDDISLILPILLPEGERKHLLNIFSGRTQDYSNSQLDRNQLRRLADMKLIRRRPGRKIRELKSDVPLDLAALVELTPFGERWARRLEKLASDPGDN